MDTKKFESYEIEEYLNENGEYVICSTIKDGVPKQLTYRDILSYIYDLECNLAGAEITIETLQERLSQKILTANWIPQLNEGNSIHSWQCSNCGDKYIRHLTKTNFCPDCGAKMLNAEEEVK